MDALRQGALQLWPDLAAQMGLNPDDWHAEVIARRSDARVQMIVLRLQGPDGPLALKLQKAPRDPEGFMQAVQAQMQATEAFPGGVPALHAVDLEAQASVMDFAAGLPLAVALESGDASDLLTQAGAWLDRFHRSTLAEPRVFQPKYTLNYLREIIAEVRLGKRAVLGQAQFLTCADTLAAREALFEGRQTQAAVPHGDLHMRNLLMGKTVTGIDLRGGNAVPVGHDIGRLLADVAILRADHDAVRPGEVLPDALSDAFFAGYTLVSREDPSVQLLLRHRVLAEWWGLPADGAGHSSAQARRWLELQSLLPRVFPSAFAG